MGKEQEFLTQLKWYAYWQLNQGYALQVKPPKYELLILVELHKIERFSSQYEQELKCLSRCIRRYIWKEENEDNLWCYLKIINIVLKKAKRQRLLTILGARKDYYLHKMFVCVLRRTKNR